MIRIWDGFLSLLAAAATAVLIGVPGWGAFLAVRSDLLSDWAWAPLAGLGLVGVVMVLAFLRKGLSGIHPLRDRRR